MDEARQVGGGSGATLVAFLRAVNVGGTGKLPMADLRRVAAEAGWGNPRTHLASGNLIGEVAEPGPAAAEVRLERALRESLGLDTIVMARTPEALAGVVARVPFEPPSRCHVGFIKAGSGGADAGVREVDPNVIARLRSQVEPDEFALAGSEVFLHYPNGQGRSKLTPAALQRVIGVPLTVRGINTINGIIDRC